MSVEIKVSDTITWSTAGAGTTPITGGKILSATRKVTCKQFEQEDENAELSSLVLYDQREEWEVEVLCPKTFTSLPAIGSEVSLGSANSGGVVATIIVLGVELKWSVGTTAKISMTLLKSVA